MRLHVFTIKASKLNGTNEKKNFFTPVNLILKFIWDTKSVDFPIVTKTMISLRKIKFLKTRNSGVKKNKILSSIKTILMALVI